MNPPVMPWKDVVIVPPREQGADEPIITISTDQHGAMFWVRGGEVQGRATALDLLLVSVNLKQRARDDIPGR